MISPSIMKGLMRSIRSASYHPFVCAFLWLFCIVYFDFCFLYCNNIEKPYRQKRRILFGMWGSIDRYSLTEFLRIFSDNILGRFHVFLKSGVGGGDCNISTIPLLSCFIFILRTKIRTFIISQTSDNVLTTYKNCLKLQFKTTYDMSFTENILVATKLQNYALNSPKTRFPDRNS